MKKSTGSYYTPKKLSDFIVKYLSVNKGVKVNSILEPSVGDGAFVESLKEHGNASVLKSDLTIVDINTTELKIASKKAKSFHSVNVINDDFVSYSLDSDEQYSLVIGNPPYINNKTLTKEQEDGCKKCHNLMGLSDKTISNIWTAFVASAVRLVNDGGVVAFVLPEDLLQVDYAKEVRELLEKEFSRIEIFSLESDVFPVIQQQTIIIFAFKESSRSGTFFFKVSDYDAAHVEMISSNGLMISKSKWTHYNLTPAEIKLLNSINKRLPRVEHYVNVKVGIVTGANKYFILPKKGIRKNSASAYSRPILTSGKFVEQGVDYTSDDFTSMSNSGCPSFLLDLNKKNRRNIKLDAYLEYGVSQGLHKRYKCSQRGVWFKVPSVGSPPQAFYFRRTHMLPKLLRNVSNVYVTDNAYRITAKNGYEIKSFVRSFYSLVTFIYAELMGRKYGGGVLELTPGEFRKLPFLYLETNDEEYETFSDGVSFNTINHQWLKSPILKEKLGINEQQMDMLGSIYSRLVSARVQ